ncbi:glycosyltransferase family 4 protein [Dermatobacter hominis]|uniref:glycosyltransferase family 4 protein n=1 Tax=Dermatobacter hominis TaxID=2884263 RepID=UPI001D11CEB6|nr:glycosyltransferase family 4 protein [Dermatobacter hominis]UDY36473.1 glycosyltransferase family 4 protein [Dermatobacter hominis]
MEPPLASSRTVDAIAELADRSGISRIHVFGWRDLDDDEAGGSEVHADSIEAIWAQAGLLVTHRTSTSVGRPPTDLRHGYRVSRRGNRYVVFPRAAVAELTGHLGSADAVIEIWNGVPFMSPLWWHGPTSVWLHHVHGPMWQQSLPGPVAALGNLLEERLAPPFYRRVPVVTLSPSSKEELVEELGFDAGHVTVIPPGIDPFFSPAPAAGPDRSPTPLCVAVGRLTPVKDFPRLVRVMAAVRERVPDVELVIVGEGYQREEIEAQVAAVGGRDWVRLPGRLSDDELLDLYRRAWLAVSASTREGWGMTLTEAAACGTPAVATDIAGHADAIDAGRSGLLGRSDSELAGIVADVLTDPELLARLRAGALERAGELTWEASALANFRVLADDALALRAVGGRRRRMPKHPRRTPAGAPRRAGAGGPDAGARP